MAQPDFKGAIISIMYVTGRTASGNAKFLRYFKSHRASIRMDAGSRNAGKPARAPPDYALIGPLAVPQFCVDAYRP